MVTMPMVADEKEGRGYDIFSRLLKDRIILLTGEVNDDSAAMVVAQMLYLSAQSKEDIRLYINSPGGSVTAGLAILDTMHCIPNDVQTIGMGMAASMGAVLLAAGTKGKRMMLPHSEAMIHQPLGGAGGQASDVLIHARHLERTREVLTGLLSDYTGKSVEELKEDMDRDRFLTASEAVAYGLADGIVEVAK